MLVISFTTPVSEKNQEMIELYSIHSFLFKNVVVFFFQLGQAEYSYFSADFRLKIFLYLFLNI